MNKKEIQEKLSQGSAAGLLREIEAYEAQCPYDLDSLSMKATYFMLLGELESAIAILQDGLKKNPYMLDFLYNLGVLYEINGDFFRAYEYFYQMNLIENKGGQGISAELNRLDAKISLKIKQINSQEEIATIKQQVAELRQKINENFNLTLIMPWSYAKQKEFGIRLKTNSDYYIAPYTRLGALQTPSIAYDKAELVKVLMQGKHLKIEIDQPSYLPILLKQSGIFTIECGGASYQMFQHFESFHYYYVDRTLEISVAGDENEIIVGNPIPLTAERNKKKLILTIFVDGLSQAFLEENGFQESMPKTHRYFSDGIHCMNFYSTGEWTYPSMAAYFSGKYSVDHKMFYPNIDHRLPEDVMTLGECLKQAGYVTAKIDGDWRTNPDYGYIRGFDRFLSGVYGEEMNIKDVISEAMDHMEALKDTNQYVYINIGELHDIGDNYKLPFDVTKRLAFKDLQDERNTGTTSVKQQFNAAKKRRFQEQMRYVDRYLGILFDYLEENFGKEDILVTLFADHGQGYLVKNEDFFLADERTKVPLLIKGASTQLTICHEYMSTVDYLPILGKLAGFDVDLTNRRSVLPLFFGGTKKRKFTVSESIYPGDTYKIALRNEEMTFFLESKEVLQSDARVRLEEYACRLQTPTGEEIQDDALKQECIDYVMEHIGYFRIYEG